MVQSIEEDDEVKEIFVRFFLKAPQRTYERVHRGNEGDPAISGIVSASRLEFGNKRAEKPHERGDPKGYANLEIAVGYYDSSEKIAHLFIGGARVTWTPVRHWERIETTWRQCTDCKDVSTYYGMNHK